MMDPWDCWSVYATPRMWCEPYAAEPELRKTMAESAFEDAWNSFRTDIVAPEYENQYRKFETLALEETDQVNHEVQSR